MERIRLDEKEFKRLQSINEGETVELGSEIRDTLISHKDSILSSIQARLEGNEEVDTETLEQIKKNVEEAYITFVDDSEDSLYTVIE